MENLKSTNETQILPLRPHHGLCIKHFEGKGYSNEFTIHMGKIIDSLSPNTLVKIMVNNDKICEKCPNNVSDSCTSLENVARYDKFVLELTGITSGEIMTYGEFFEILNEKIIKAGHFKEICSDCGWAEICHKTNH